MSGNDRKHDDDDLLSAYLDGELSPAERAQFEEQLARDPEQRRLLDEFRQLSTQLHNLPRRELGSAFADRVLAKAEEEMLLASSTAADARSTDEPVTIPLKLHTIRDPHQRRPADIHAAERRQAAGRSSPRRLRMPRGRRPWLWASVAIAAGLMLMIYGQTFDRWQLAENPKGKNTTAVLPTAGTPTTGGAKDNGTLTDRDTQLFRNEPRGVTGELPVTVAPPQTSTMPTNAPVLPTNTSYVRPVSPPIVAEELTTFGYSPQLSEHLAQQAAAVDLLNPMPPTDNSLWVIEVEVDAAKLTSDPFAQVLGDNSILASTVPQVQLANLQNNLTQTRVAGENAKKDATGAQQIANNVNAGGVDLVYVVATPAQLQQTVAQVESLKTTFSQVTVHNAAPGVGNNQVNEKLGTAVDALGKNLETPGRARVTDNSVDETQVPASKSQSATPAAEPKEQAKHKAEDLKSNLRSNGYNGSNVERAWFNRLTFPPTEELRLSNSYGALRKSTSAAAGAATSNSIQVQAANKEAARGIDAMVREGTAKQLASDKLAAEQKAKLGERAAVPGAEAQATRDPATGQNWQRALFVFHVIDSRAGTPATAAPTPAASATPATPPAPVSKPEK